MDMMTNGWSMYTDNDLKASTKLIKENAGLVKKIAHHLKAKLPPNVQVEDLIQAGMIGLLEAASKYDETKGASFETYAGIRIRGSMLDEIRKGDWAPRSVHRNTRRISEVIRKIEHETGKDATPKGIAKALSVSLDEYHNMLQDSAGARVFGFEDLGAQEDIATTNLVGNLPEVLEGVQEIDFQAKLAKAIHRLPARDKFVLSLYYEEEMNLREVGEIVGVSESRVSQIHTQAMHKLQDIMRDWNII